ncbi:MAG: helix-turn-helix domain-containing protein [Ancrocorticia sp.]|jgi:transcriptional regulator with XRE-family HTH domain|nr:helix-turn-helix domain-containing protein [Ancrocorticia sp.]MCI2193304.1 helix-turn-helix domain-containing protein [Ancrocorticia sp.]MCI2198733.1 helix-turn-helix domain-containing protein [Ancrocorticia sp.]
MEAGRGIPDIENLKALADALGVSVDYLLGAAEAREGRSTIRMPLPAVPTDAGAGQHAVIAHAFPNAQQIFPLMRVNNRVQEIWEWVLAFVCDAPFGVFQLGGELRDRAVFYLVEEPNRQLLARLGNELIEAHEVAVTGKRFTRYRRRPALKTSSSSM